MIRLTVIGWVALVLAIIGSINWGLVGLFDFNLVSAIFGVMTPLARIIYILVGLAGIWLLIVALSSRSTRTAASKPA